MERTSWSVMLMTIILFLAGTGNPAVSGAEKVMPQPKEHAREILNRSLFQHWKLRHQKIQESASGGFSESLREMLDRWRNNEIVKEILSDIADWLKELFSGDEPSKNNVGEGIFSLTRILYYLGWLSLFILVMFLAVVLYRSWRGTNKGEVTKARIVRREQVRDAIEAGDALALSDDEWLRETQRLAADGEYRLMYRSLYLALLSGLHQRGRIKFHRYRTNWHYVNNYRGPDNHREEFSSLTSMFDRIWYGHRGNGEEYPIEKVRKQVRDLLSGSGDEA